jgi:hypothetical protein
MLYVYCNMRDPVSSEGSSGGSSALENYDARGHAWWLPEMFQTAV